MDMENSSDCILCMPAIVQIARSREEAAAKLVERHSHDPVCQVESLLHPITVVNVNVHIKYPTQQQASIRQAHPVNAPDVVSANEGSLRVLRDTHSTAGGRCADCPPT